jgi:hypothetical protein
MNNKPMNGGKENAKVLAWFRKHKAEIELMQRLQPHSPVIALLNKILEYHNSTGRWPLLMPRSAWVLKNAFGDALPLEIQK